jgi:hypothetical protein
MPMPNLFGPRADVVMRLGMALVGAVICAGGGVLFVYGDPSWAIEQRRYVSQPVMFSHQHHVGKLGLDCRYCHQTVESSDFAGVPAPDTCMGCHAALYTTAPILEPVRAAWRGGAPVAWNRVYRLPDVVHFSHQVHVSAGVACVSCHGRMDEQPLTMQATPLRMGWCLSCHRHPERALVPMEERFDPRATPGSARNAGARVDRRDILTSCSACHY